METVVSSAMAPKVSNADLMREVKSVGADVRDVKLEVRGGEDQASRDSSLRGQVISLRSDFAGLNVRMATVEKNIRLASPEQAEENRTQGIGTRRIAYVGLGGLAANVAVLVFRTMGWLP